MKRNRRQRLFTILTAIACLPAALHCQTPAQAEAFVRRTYNKYNTKSDQDPGPEFLRRDAPTVFSPGLIRLIRRDQRQTPRGDVGKLDYDPICSCQDFFGLKLAGLRIVKVSAGKATAFVTLEPFSRSLKLHLIWLPQGWRIDDIESEEAPSLRKYLQ